MPFQPPARTAGGFVQPKTSASAGADAAPDVGADAHIGPAEQAVFTEIFGEFVTSQRADVGIGPYTETGKGLRFCCPNH